MTKISAIDQYAKAQQGKNTERPRIFYKCFKCNKKRKKVGISWAVVKHDSKVVKWLVLFAQKCKITYRKITNPQGFWGTNTDVPQQKSTYELNNRHTNTYAFIFVVNFPIKLVMLFMFCNWLQQHIFRVKSTRKYTCNRKRLRSI